MNQYCRFAALAAIALCIAAPASAAEHAADELAIRDGVTRWLTAFKEGNLESLMALYMPDAMVALHGQTALVGTDNIRAYFAPGMGKSDIDFDITIDEIRIHGDVAYLISRYWFTATPLDGSAAYRDAGRSVVLYVRDHDGQWKIKLDMDQETPDVRFE